MFTGTKVRWNLNNLELSRSDINESFTIHFNISNPRLNPKSLICVQRLCRSS